MSKYIITIQRTDYVPEGNHIKQTTVFQQEVINDDDVVRRVAISTNTSKRDIKDIMTELKLHSQ